MQRDRFMSDELKIGNINLREIDLYNFLNKKYSLLGTFTFLDIQEDMFAPVCSGSIQLLDTSNLLEDFPISGEERLVITYRTAEPFKWVTREFYVYDVTNKMKSSDKGFVYTLHFCSVEMLKNRTTLVSKSFKNLTPSDIVKTVLTNIIETKKPLNIEKSFGVYTYIAPHIYPFEVIHSMSNRARSDSHHDGASYLFFENKNGCNFVSLEEIVKGTPFTYVARDNNSYDNTNETTRFTSISAISQTKGFSVLDSISSGAFGVKTKALDLMTKQLTDISYDHFDDSQYKSMNRINGNNPKLKMTTSNFKFKSNDGLYKYVVTSSGVGSSFKDKNVSKRYSQLSSYVNGPKVNIEVNFNSDMTVGRVINLEVMTGHNSDKETELAQKDSYQTGKYLVTAMRHIITLDKATTSMELSRDSYTADHEKLTPTRNARLGL